MLSKKLAHVVRLLRIEPQTLFRLNQAPNATIFCAPVPPIDALDHWHRLRNAVDDTQYWPVVLGGQDHVYWHRQRVHDYYLSDPTPVSRILAAARTIDPEQWLHRHLDDLQHTYRFSVENLHGDWQDGAAAHTYIAPYDQTEPVYLALLPTCWSWHVPALLHFGYHNFSPPPEVHVSLFKRWHRLYGAEVVGMAGSDVLEMRVTRPPRTREHALALAYEHYTYCPDIVEQVTRGKIYAGSLEALASSLLDGTVWYFWWD